MITDPTARRIAGGAIVAVTLIIAADFPTTAPLAVSFGYLLLISTVLLVGPAAFSNLSAMLDTPAAGGGKKKR